MRPFILLLAAGALLSASDKLIPVDETAFQKLLTANKGKVLVVDFWATWCKPCRAEMPELVKLEGKMRARGLKLVTVSADEPEKEGEALKFANQLGVPAPVYTRKAKDDDKFINAVDTKWSGALPALFIYDKSGRMAKSFIGESSMKDVEAAVAKLL